MAYQIQRPTENDYASSRALILNRRTHVSRVVGRSHRPGIPSGRIADESLAVFSGMQVSPVCRLGWRRSCGGCESTRARLSSNLRRESGMTPAYEAACTMIAILFALAPLVVGLVAVGVIELPSPPIIKVGGRDRVPASLILLILRLLRLLRRSAEPTATPVQISNSAARRTRAEAGQRMAGVVRAGFVDHPAEERMAAATSCPGERAEQAGDLPWCSTESRPKNQKNQRCRTRSRPAYLDDRGEGSSMTPTATRPRRPSGASANRIAIIVAGGLIGRGHAASRRRFELSLARVDSQPPQDRRHPKRQTGETCIPEILPGTRQRCAQKESQGDENAQRPEKHESADQDQSATARVVVSPSVAGLVSHVF